MDSNVTTLIAAAVLFGIGTGPVRGFAVTLSIGIITTVFTAFTLTRLIVALVRRRPKEDPSEAGYVACFASFRTTPNSNSCGSGALAFLPVGALSILHFALFLPRCNVGIDFKGGTFMRSIRRPSAANLGQMRANYMDRWASARPSCRSSGLPTTC